MTIVGCTALLALGALSTRSSSRQGLKESQASLKEMREKLKVKDIQVHNKTRAFEIVNIEMLGDAEVLRMTLRNGYDKSVTGFQVNIGAVRSQPELSATGHDTDFIPPGGTYTRLYGTQIGLDKLGITVLCVVFEDGSSDGEPKYVEEIKEYRLGIRMARERVLPLLRDAMNLPDQERLDKLESWITALPGFPEEGLSLSVKLGLQGEDHRMLREIGTLKHQWLHRQQIDMSREPEPGDLPEHRDPRNWQELVEYYEHIIAKARI